MADGNLQVPYTAHPLNRVAEAGRTRAAGPALATTDAPNWPAGLRCSGMPDTEDVYSVGAVRGVIHHLTAGARTAVSAAEQRRPPRAPRTAINGPAVPRPSGAAKVMPAE